MTEIIFLLDILLSIAATAVLGWCVDTFFQRPVDLDEEFIKEFGYKAWVELVQSHGLLSHNKQFITDQTAKECDHARYL